MEPKRINHLLNLHNNINNTNPNIRNMKTHKFIAITTGNISIIPNGIKKEVIEITQDDTDGVIGDGEPEEELINEIIQGYIDEANQQFCNVIILSMDQWELITKETEESPKQPNNELQGTYRDGTECLFKAHGMEEELGETLDCTDLETGIEFIKQLQGQKVTIICLATYTELGDPDYEYYDIETEDGTILEGISGYHLYPLI